MGSVVDELVLAPGGRVHIIPLAPQAVVNALVAGVIVRQVAVRALILFFGWFPVDVVIVAYPGLVLADGERPFIISVVLGNLFSLDPASPTTHHQ